MKRRLHIAFVTPEMAPLVKTGGLGDYAAALPKALARLGHRVTVVMPRYRGVPLPTPVAAASCGVDLAGEKRPTTYFRQQLGAGVDVVLIEQPSLFDREQPYGDYADNHLRFAFLARAALEYFRAARLRPDVIHAHDWQAGLVPTFQKSAYPEDPFVGRVPCVFTIHNVAYQGSFGLDALGPVGIPAHLATPEGLEFFGEISYLKAGVVFSELVTTVSPQYARELLGPEQSYGFDGILRARGEDFVGVLNGVDYDVWDPRLDPQIAQRFSRDDPAGKTACKADLLRAFGLPEFPDLPVVGAVSRLVWQKGFDIVATAWWDIVQRPLRMVVIGTGEEEVKRGLSHLRDQAADRVAVRFVYDEALAHKVIAGSDMLLVPSRYEPCGLTQMYALRYGTAPIVRATGGLADTVEQFSKATRTGTGFRFDAPDGTGLVWALDQALAARKDKPAWARLMANAMERDFSWDRSATEYVALYRRAHARA